MNSKMKIQRIILVIGFFTLALLTLPPALAEVSEINNEEVALLYSSYFGGTENDHGLCIVQDSQGNMLIAGITYSNDLPTTENAYDQTFNGEADVFITKWSNDGTELLFSTYLGGSESDTYIGSTGIAFQALDIAVDSKDNIVIYGATSSDDFPVTTGSINETYHGNQDLFITKLAKNGSTLLFSTYVGGSERDYQNLGNNRLVVDNEDTIYITGQTKSTDFPVTVNAINDTFQVQEVFLCKINPEGDTLLYSTLLGGSGQEFGMGLALDSDKNMIIGGTTQSSDFPITAEAYDQTYSESILYITKIAENGSTLLFSTFLGGTNWDQLAGIHVDTKDDLYITGSTGSTNFPTTDGVLRNDHNTEFEVFISKLAANGSTLLASSFLSGTSRNFASGLTLSKEGDPYIIGYTKSTNFPTTANAYDSTLDGTTDYFIAGLNPDLTELKYSTYLGGSSTDDHGKIEAADGHDAGEMVMLSSETVMMVGSTRSNDYPVTTDAINKSWNGAADIFITQIKHIPPTTTTTSEPGFEIGVLALLVVLIKRKKRIEKR